jgi:hypothetical protein
MVGALLDDCPGVCFGGLGPTLSRSYTTQWASRLFVRVLTRDEPDAWTQRNKWFFGEARTQRNISRIQTPRAASSITLLPAAARQVARSSARHRALSLSLSLSLSLRIGRRSRAPSRN